jgi:hypothetical protein
MPSRTADRDFPPVHRALQAARKAAGFETAAAAAAHFRWSVGRYRSHETGARRIPDEDVHVYAKSFKVTLASLRNPDREAISRQLDHARQASEKPRRTVAQRLRAARILRGLASAIEASKALGIGTPTYLKHENGGNGIQNGMIEFYADEYSISRDWLSSGSLPSGLGPELDFQIHDVLKNPEKFVDYAPAKFDRGHWEERLRSASGRPGGVIAIPEYRWSAIAEQGGDVQATTPSGVVQLPRSADQPNWPTDIVSVLLDVATPYARPFSRIFITRSLTPHDVGSTEYLAASNTKMAIVKFSSRDLSKAQGLVGRLVGRLDAPM